MRVIRATLVVSCVVAGCARSSLPIPSVTPWTTFAPDTSCRSPVGSASHAIRRRKDLPRFEDSLRSLDGDFNITLVITYPALPDSERTSTGTLSFWPEARIRAYRPNAEPSAGVVGVLDAPMFDPGGGIRFGRDAEPAIWPGDTVRRAPNFFGRRYPDGSLRWMVNPGLDSGWQFGVFQGNGSRLRGRWSWMNSSNKVVVAGYFCAARRGSAT
jgi:hypothetical protein